MIDASMFFDESIADIAVINGKEALVYFDQKRYIISNGINDVLTIAPQVTIQTADIDAANAVQGSTVFVRNKNYEIKEIEDDGNGVAVVRLYEKI